MSTPNTSEDLSLFAVFCRFAEGYLMVEVFWPLSPDFPTPPGAVVLGKN
jgi:hypothetical protein